MVVFFSLFNWDINDEKNFQRVDRRRCMGKNDYIIDPHADTLIPLQGNTLKNKLTKEDIKYLATQYGDEIIKTSKKRPIEKLSSRRFNKGRKAIEFVSIKPRLRGGFFFERYLSRLIRSLVCIKKNKQFPKKIAFFPIRRFTYPAYIGFARAHEMHRQVRHGIP